MTTAQLLERLTTLIEQGQEIDFIVPQDTGWFSIEDELIARIEGLIDQTAELMGAIMEVFDTQEEGFGDDDSLASESVSDSLRELGSRISTTFASREISGLAFVCRGQLFEITELLTGALERKEIWLVASYADTGLRRARKGLIALESAIREFEGLPALDRRWVDVEDSLEIRRLYGQFRRAILRRHLEGRDSLKSHLKSAANRIAILRDLKIYPFLRIDDRREIRRLQKRILAWLGGEGDASDEAGERLWVDLVSFASLLTQINNREELREHDQRVVAKLYHQLFLTGKVPEKVPPALQSDLETLLGRDDELDQVILSQDRMLPEVLREPIERLRKELRQGALRG